MMTDEEAIQELWELRYDIQLAAQACCIACRRQLERQSYLCSDYLAASRQIELAAQCRGCDGKVIEAIRSFVSGVDAFGLDNLQAEELAQTISQ